MRNSASIFDSAFDTLCMFRNETACRKSKTSTWSSDECSTFSLKQLDNPSPNFTGVSKHSKCGLSLTFEALQFRKKDNISKIWNKTGPWKRTSENVEHSSEWTFPRVRKSTRLENWHLKYQTQKQYIFGWFYSDITT